MSVLLETSLGDVVIDLDYTRDKLRYQLCENVTKLAECRYYTNTLIWNVQSTKYAQFGCPRGDGSGGCSYEFLLNESLIKNDSKRKKRGRFLTVDYPTALRTNDEKSVPIRRGLLLAVPMTTTSSSTSDHNNDSYNIGSQFMLLTSDDDDVIEGGIPIGAVTEDNDQVLQKLNELYCDGNGRPYVDVRVRRALVVYDPFTCESSSENNLVLHEHERLLKQRGVSLDGSMSPEYDRPPEEIVESRISAEDYLNDQGGGVGSIEETAEVVAQRAEEVEKKDAKSRAVVLEMLGDLPDADVKAPENVLFVCKLNPVTDDEDLELIFSRFDSNAKADIIRDPQTNESLCYAFIEFSTKEQCTEAYFKMNNALIDDRRIKVDFSQSVSHIWNRFTQQFRRNKDNAANGNMRGSFPKDPYRDVKKNHHSSRERGPVREERRHGNYSRSELNRHDERARKKTGSDRDTKPYRRHQENEQYIDIMDRSKRDDRNRACSERKMRHRSRSRSRDRSRGNRKHERKHGKRYRDRSSSEDSRCHRQSNRKERKTDYRKRSLHDRDNRKHHRERESSRRHKQNDDRDRNRRY